ncbi:MAG: hypothetical protein WCR42_08270 [bacterium]
MTKKELTSKEYFRYLSLIHLALVSGLALFGIFAYYLVSMGLFAGPSMDLYKTFGIMVIIVVIAGFGVSMYMTKTRMESTKVKTDLKTKLGDYQATTIIKLALLEGPGLFAIVAYMLTANYIVLAIAGLIIVYFFFNIPSQARVIKDLELNSSEIALMENPDAVVAIVQVNSKKW